MIYYIQVKLMVDLMESALLYPLLNSEIMYPIMLSLYQQNEVFKLLFIKHIKQASLTKLRLTVPVPWTQYGWAHF